MSGCKNKQRKWIDNQFFSIMNKATGFLTKTWGFEYETGNNIHTVLYRMVTHSMVLCLENYV